MNLPPIHPVRVVRADLGRKHWREKCLFAIDLLQTVKLLIKIKGNKKKYFNKKLKIRL